MNMRVSLAAALVGVVALAIGAAIGRGEDGPVGCGDVPVPAPTLKVHFQQTPGVGDFKTHPAVDLDDKHLSTEEAEQLRKMIEDANFFDLKSTPPRSPVPPDDMVGYDLAVELDGLAHDIWVEDADVGKSLRPLIDALKARSRLIELHNSWVVPLKGLEKEQQAIRVEITRSGGITGRFHQSSTIDGTKLSAEDARKLASLIEDSRFFDRPDHYPIAPDVIATTVTIEMNDKKHSVSFDATPAELKPLLDWLSQAKSVEPC
jgi:hypothetical protein